MVENPKGPFQKHKNEQDVEENIEQLSINEQDDVYPESEEFQAIDDQLNMLNSVLDNLEHKNDVILAELTALLKENREIRKQLQQTETPEKYDEETNK